MHTEPKDTGIPKRWFALAVKRRREKTVADGLRDRDIESFLPLTRLRRQWSDRTRVLDAPLFPGYVFCRCDFESRLAVLGTPGVAAFVSFGQGPATVPAAEIEGVRAIVDSRLPAVDGPYLPVGQRVRIAGGPLAGLEGILIRERDAARVVVNVEILRRSVSVEVDRAMICALTGGAVHRAGAAPVIA
jgi:transcription antitermination factor NusG